MCYMGIRKATVGVRELRQNLSVHLDRVKAGETLTVTEHRQVVAVLGPAVRADDRVARMMAEGRAMAPGRAPDRRPKPLAIRLAVPLSRLVDQLGEDTI